ncbi:MAG TPA: hypothetical protein VFJ50_05575 [Gemmatimonadales bacterium]|nr:hypothetical protein [Gemmatimonadales bacterium]
MRSAESLPDAPRMWLVTTRGDLPDDYEQREYTASAAAWNDYHGRILEFEIAGFARNGEESSQYGRPWICDPIRGVERMTVGIERAT